MVRTQVYLTPKQHRALKREAARAGISMTECLRRILDLHILGAARPATPRHEQVLAFLDLGESGSRDVAENHDAALDEAFGAGSLR